jgi:hypothetical protein
MIFRPFISIILVFVSQIVNGANISAISNGPWTAASTWDLNRAPQDNDVVTIPSTKQVFFNGAPYPKNTPAVRPTLFIKIYGILDFSNAGNDKLYLDAGSQIEIFTNGKIQTSASSSEIIAIYDGSIDNTVWTGTPAIINGPVNATATTSGFANGILPVKLESFEIKKSTDGFAELTWRTSSEYNSSAFQIESLNSALHSWHVAGSIKAAGFSSSPINYKFSVQLLVGENQFRLKQIDADGKFTYSPIVSMRLSNDNNIKIQYSQTSHEVIINGAAQPGSVVISDVSGRTVFKGKIAAPVIFKPALPGIYIFNVIVSTDRIVKKIMVY